MIAQKIEISHRTIIFSFLFLLGLWFLFQIKDIILALFVSLVLSSALNPSVNRLESLRLPRWLAILVIYIVVLGFLLVLLAGLIPPLIDQTASFIEKAPAIFATLNLPGFDSSLITSQFSRLIELPGNILRWTVGVFSNIINFFALIVLTFYLLLERKNLDKYLLTFFGKEGEKRASRFVKRVEERLGGWVRGELILMTTIGVISYFGLRILGIEYALPLAILAGLTEIIPYIGPVAAAIPAVLLGLVISPFMGLAVCAFYFLVQQIEGNVVVPKVMEKAAGVNPLITILALAIGFKLAGIAGAILALPAVLLLEVVAIEAGLTPKLSRES